MSTAPKRPSAKSEPSLWPREHGAYVELLAPLCTALLFAPLSLAGIGYAVAGCAAFLTHEPVLILLGRRGERTRAQLRQRAQRRLTVCTAVGIAGLFAGLTFATPSGRLAALVPSLFALLAGYLVLINREKHLTSELVIATTLTSFSFPVLVSAGLSMRWAAGLTLAWCLVHALGTVTGKAFVYRKRDEGRLLKLTTLGVLLIAACAPALAWFFTIPWSWCLVATPFALVLVLLRVGVFEPRTPKPVGWALAAANVAALVLFGLGLVRLV